MNKIKKILMAGAIAALGVVGLSSTASADEPCNTPVVAQPVAYGYGAYGREGWRERRREETFRHRESMRRVRGERRGYGRW